MMIVWSDFDYGRVKLTESLQLALNTTVSRKLDDRMAKNWVNMDCWIDQQEYKLHELEQIIDNVKEWSRESYNKFMNESGQN